MLESIADPTRLRIVRYLDEHRAASVTELAEVAGVHANTMRPHLQALEADGVIATRQREARGPGRRVIEYFLLKPLSRIDSDVMPMAELLAAALVRAQIDAAQLRRIGADWGRYRSGRPGDQDPAAQLHKVLSRFGFHVEVDADAVHLERCLCPLVSPDAPVNVCVLIEGVVEGALVAGGSNLRVNAREHNPQVRSCRLGLSVAP